MLKTLKSLAFMLGSLCPLLGLAQEERSSVTADFPCPPDEITITKFKDSQLFKKWKVVVNREFNYKATPKNNTDNWTWALGDLNAASNGVVVYWHFQNPLTEHGGSGIIPLNELVDRTNSDLGPAHGHIQANANLNNVPKQDLSDAPEQTVQVFFNKDDLHPTSGQPLWAHYWQQINVLPLTIPGIPEYNPNTCQFDPLPVDGIPLSVSYDQTVQFPELGNISFPQGTGVPSCNGSGLGTVVANYDQSGTVIKVGPGACLEEPCPNGETCTGIHVFYRTIIHEREHMLIKCQVWATGWASNWDMDNDRYRDDFEDDLNALRPAGAGYAFSVGPNGSQNDIYGPYQANNLGQNPPAYSAGTEYEEWRCRQAEDALNLNGNIHDVDQFDWSCGGKQW